jgi:hypothetical protein
VPEKPTVRNRIAALKSLFDFAERAQGARGRAAVRPQEDPALADNPADEPDVVEDEPLDLAAASERASLPRPELLVCVRLAIQDRLRVHRHVATIGDLYPLVDDAERDQ